ncbi:MAG: response regulator [Myxococcales bacterium]
MGSTQAPRLLVVDDSIDILDSLEMVLDDMGYAVDTARSGHEALERMRSAAYGLVLCDVGMPEMNGWQVAREIRSVSPATKVFMLTGVADQIDDDDPRLGLVDGVLPKPIEIDWLERFLGEQLPA